jgi:hypothetical protein
MDLFVDSRGVGAVPASKKSVIKNDSAATAVQQILSLFGPPPLLSTESREHFERVLTHFVSAIESTCAIAGMVQGFSSDAVA